MFSDDTTVVSVLSNDASSSSYSGEITHACTARAITARSGATPWAFTHADTETRTAPIFLCSDRCASIPTNAVPAITRGMIEPLTYVSEPATPMMLNTTKADTLYITCSAVRRGASLRLAPATPSFDGVKTALPASATPSVNG